ncbi:MAG: tRNA dihydrouridine synthase DusB [Lachnospiraceae bacterium]|nr:tRNA dihydrouridine synthase DusB [Lachnospiraceae bacterium]
MSKLTIGNVTLDNQVILAPMAGVTDLPFRLLCRKMGAGLVCMEMVSAKAIYYHNKNTEELLNVHPGELPASLQLFGSDPEILAQMAAKVEERPYSFIDLNMGCPVPKVVNNGEGSALMKNPKLVEEILTAMVKAVKKPVTIKIRKGFNDTCVNAVEIAKIAESCGVAAVAVHGRTREQYYSGQADWDIIRRVKEAVKIPVIGNGDVDSPQKAAMLLEQTGCDGVMIGRGAQGNPWIFREIVQYLESGVLPEKPTNAEKRELILQHAAMELEYKGEYTAVREMRRHLSWYTFGMPNSAKFRGMINQMETMDALRESVERIFGEERRES